MTCPAESSYNLLPTQDLERALQIAEEQKQRIEEQLLSATVTVQALINVLQRRTLV